MTYSQKHEELIQIVAEALKNSGRTCDEDSWPYVMASEAVRVIAREYDCIMDSHDQTAAAECAGLRGIIQELENGPDRYHRYHEIHEGNCITCYRMGDKEIV